jgi:hypothetical protein
MRPDYSGASFTKMVSGMSTLVGSTRRTPIDPLRAAHSDIAFLFQRLVRNRANRLGRDRERLANGHLGSAAPSASRHSGRDYR